MKLDPGSVAELKRVISKQASEIAKLKEQLNLKNAELKTANTDAFNSERNAREEATRREDAEARLKEYLDAQKRMAAMYSGA
jgi:predicted Holliday junction resolvase-like endonuclease